MIVIVPSAERAKTLRDELAEWCRPGARILLFPELDILPYERLTPDPSIVHQRLRAMAVLSEWAKSPNGNPPVVVASAHAVAQKTLSPTEFAPACRAVKKGMKLDPAQLVAQAVAIGYETSEIVESAGTISKRGGIVDIFSPNHDHPARIEFFGNEVESLRWFNPVTQRSTGPADSVLIVPAREMLFGSKDRIQRALAGLDFSNCRDRAREIVQEDIALLSSGQWRDGLEFYAPVLNISTIVDHLPGDPLIVVDDPEAIAAEMEEVDSHAAGLRLGQTERGELPTNFPQPYLSWPELEAKLARTRRFLSLEKWGREGSEPLFRFNLPPGYMGQLARFLEDARKELDSGTRMIVVSQQASRVSELLHGHDMLATVAPNIEGLPPAGSLTVLRGSLTGGWKLNGTLLLTDAELFGFVKERRPVPKRTAQHEVFLADLAVGDYVVHVDHGIARFNGTTRMAADGIEREYLVLEYAEGDKLYVPTDQVDRVSRYVGSGGYVPALSRLNTQEWARTKERVKHATREMAEELLAIYAAREVSPGIAFDPDSPWERQLEASFPYMETPDQARTIHEVKQDMESAKPMDRLVCGDVGYGKTEIAVRAAFKAVANGMQVAVLVPTTVLAQQHYVTFTHRLAAFPVSVEMLSRFRSPKEQQKVIEGLAAGSVDICIGTHRLLQNDVVFHNLGLVIIDEEQKFGVAHKEKLKKLRSEVDVLTITATPIPRTLHMAMVGARDMSTIETAPEARLPIKTYVSEIDPQIVREAILRELDRKGQVFFVHNRVQSIGWVAEQLKDLVPEAKIAIGHGQMPEDMLESVMYDFTTGKYNVLVCTTIIESGIDLPNANTLIVNQADRLGLTQLYHLRGRVGRSDVRAYAYLFYDKGKRLTEIAQKRLKTIFEATELGAGFRIAMKDLEIRGAGNILGAEQSGQVGAVGFDLYCRLLADAVAELKAGGAKPVPRPELPTVDLPIAAHIPESYVPDLAARLALYHRLVKLDSPEKVKDLQQEIKDRFGKIPAPVENLLYGVRVKLMALKAGVQKVFTEDKQLILAMDGQALAAKSVKLRMFGSSVKVGPSQVRLDMGRTGNQWPRMLEEVLRVMGR
ncbi:MAG: transcription-repair coupling factor [Chloroflexi bacterium]|nr:transcription-repair coupling factor [Chloroflexota bacterium]